MPSPRISVSAAYLSVVGGIAALFCSVGFFIAFGIFQGYYKDEIMRDKSDFDISWIGSVLVFLLYISAPGCGVLVDVFGPRAMLVGGSVGVLLSIFLTSLCTQYYQFFLCQAVLLGISMAFITWPPMAVVSRHLPHRRGLALGIVTGGSSIGGVIWPIMIDQLLYKRELGFPWTMRVVGFTMMPILLIACLTITEPKTKPQVPQGASLAGNADSGASGGQSDGREEEKEKEKEPPSLLRNPVFVFLCLGFGLGFFGVFNPFFYISSYAAAHGVSPETSFYMISIINAASLLGRVVPGYLADRFGHYNVIICSLLSSGIISFCWTAVTSLSGLIVWSLVYGFFAGAILSLPGACVGKIATPRNQGRAIGFLQGTSAMTVLFGSPIGGQLLGKYGYLPLSMFTGATLSAGAVCLIAARLKLDSSLLASV
ncbi:Riboflavin transporter MCH5 [Escovopsis weberi]|uniref:Riboflavin transporter MCH5 n=1 Tax=Escovopsis weberi TaxID=150374 RepID=A0A0M8N2B8_ESCWE|nr:Riboflavin transporter MCH5 [Escovopsis weberi]